MVKNTSIIQLGKTGHALGIRPKFNSAEVLALVNTRKKGLAQKRFPAIYGIVLSEDRRWEIVAFPGRMMVRDSATRNENPHLTAQLQKLIEKW